MRTTYYNTKKLCILPRTSTGVSSMIRMWNTSYRSSLFIQTEGLLPSKGNTAFYSSSYQFRIYSERVIYTM